MPALSSVSFDDEIQRRVYEYVERNGAVTRPELIRSVRLESESTQSKPARSGTYTHEVPPSPDELRSCVETLRDRGYLVESNGKLRIALPGAPSEHDLEPGRVTIRPAREADRTGIVETMRAVAANGSYVVAANLAERLERESALVRVDGDRSRICFAAVLEPAADDSGSDRPERDVVGWLHLEAPGFPSRSHVAAVTVGVDPEQRRVGIGSRLLEYGLEWADDAGYRKLYQGVPATNDGAIEFLEENGWRREGEREEHYCIDDEFVDEVLLAIWPSER
ncbi:GNAT family N-acetyltransferase [Halopiger djelfimassiliensis]|uniref:GNAT family N-acetyltransferase n=1 Tax=Halopiger djelfimassiliensis TaxID=1293047 RepID=UPI0006777414|nr:N-acetyltransferase [Halopiger djelfimassiliensis]